MVKESIKKILVLTACISIFGSFTSTAGIDLGLAGKYNEDSLIVIETAIRNRNESNTFSNYNLDEYGEIHYLFNDVSYLTDGYSPEGVYFDTNGVFIPFGSDKKAEYDKYCRKLESGLTVEIECWDEFIKIVDYYNRSYNISTVNQTGHFYQGSDGSYTLSFDKNFQKYNKNLIKNQIMNKYGTLQGNSVYEKILDACDKVSTMQYDLSYSNADIQKCLKDNKGVCKHYEKVVKVLLEEAGIESETIHVESLNNLDSYGKPSLHVLLRVKCDDRWVYVDPTAYRGDPSYCNMNYKVFENSYKLFMSTSIAE